MFKKKLSISVLCRVAFLIALEVVLSRFCSINTMGLRIGFAFVPMALCAIMYGPAVTAAAYALSDLLGATLFPTGPYFPGFTFSAALMGLSYGLFLHRHNFWRSSLVFHAGARVLQAEKVRAMIYIFSTTIINCLVLGLGLNTLWITILYGHNYSYWFLYRLPEYALLVPLNIILLPLIIKFSERIKHSSK